MEKEKTYYTIEREFLDNITVIELVSRMIRRHIESNSEKEEDFQ